VKNWNFGLPGRGSEVGKFCSEYVQGPPDYVILNRLLLNRAVLLSHVCNEEGTFTWIVAILRTLCFMMTTNVITDKYCRHYGSYIKVDLGWESYNNSSSSGPVMNTILVTLTDLCCLLLWWNSFLCPWHPHAHRLLCIYFSINVQVLKIN